MTKLRFAPVLTVGRLLEFLADKDPKAEVFPYEGMPFSGQEHDAIIVQDPLNNKEIARITCFPMSRISVQEIQEDAECEIENA